MQPKAIPYNGSAKERTLSEIVRLAWDRFKIIVSIVGDVQGRAILTLFYFTILVPFGLGARLFGDSLRLRSASQTWLERPPVASSLDDARRQG